MRNLNSEAASSPASDTKNTVTAALKRPTRPVISTLSADQFALKRICPANAIGINPVRIDLGKCEFCDACAVAFPSKIRFSDDPKLATNVRDRLIVIEGEETPVVVDSGMIRESNHFLPATVNLMVMGKQNVSSLISSPAGIHFVTAAEKAHGLIFTEEITSDLEEQVSLAYEQMLLPKLIILAGAQAISRGVFDDRNKNLAGFMSKYPVDLYVPGNPFHQVSLTEAVKELIVLSQFRKNNIRA